MCIRDSLKVGHEEKTETQPNPLDEYYEVIGKTKIVYLEDPDMARKTPTRSEPMTIEPIEEDEDIDPDDVIDGFSHKLVVSVCKIKFFSLMLYYFCVNSVIYFVAPLGTSVVIPVAAYPVSVSR